VDRGRLERITDNPRRPPRLRGYARGYAMRRVVYAPDRLTHPLLAAGPRGSGRFREASWEEALRLVAGRLADIRDRHGPQAVLSLGGSGSCRGAQHNTGLLAAHSRWTYPEFVDTLNCTRGSVSGGYPNTTCLPKMRPRPSTRKASSSLWLGSSIRPSSAPRAPHIPSV